MVNPKNYTGPPLPCGWPGCQAILKNPVQHHAHCLRCFGKGLPALVTGIRCDILKCTCGGVDFPSTQRLKRHQDNIRRVGLDSKKVQCLSAACGCGRWFKSVTRHLSRQQQVSRDAERGEADLQQPDMYNTRSTDQGKRKESIPNVGNADGEKIVRVNQHSKVQDDEDDGEDIDYDDDDDYNNDELAEPASKGTRAEQFKTNIKLEEVIIKVEAQDHASAQPAYAAKVKSDVVDLTQNTDDDDAPGAFKKVTVASLLAPHADLPAIAQAEVATKAPVASSTAAESRATDQRDNNVTTRFLLDLLKSQQSQMTIQANQIAMLTEAVLGRK